MSKKQIQRRTSPDAGPVTARPSTTPGKRSRTQSLTPVQRRASPAQADDHDAVHQAAAHGTQGMGGELPHRAAIQGAFGRHDVSSVQAYQGQAATEANQAMGASAFATGDKIAFAGSPDLHTAAHEAAHVVQQRSGVALSGGVGQAGDSYERHADQVADAVVRGESAEGLLDQTTGQKSNN